MARTGPVRPSLAAVILLVVAIPVATHLTGAPHELYPNELPGFKLFAHARWNALRPFISTQAEAFALLGPPQPVLYDVDDDWQMIIMYIGEGSCIDKPWPSFLKERISEIRLMPRRRVSFSTVRFPRVFTRSEGGITHHAVDRVLSYTDAHGLKYEVWDGSSDDGSIRTGDLKAIVYGPSRKVYQSMTGCEP